MIRRVEDVDAVAAEYLAGLNACFPGWGDERMFDWCFRRRVGGPAADLIVAAEQGRLVAGCALTYRRVRRAGGETEPMGCITGAWTLPQARGQGLFAKLADGLSDIARENGIPLVGAWGAAGNGSFSTMTRRSDLVIEAAFLTSKGGEVGPSAAPVTADEAAKAFQGRRHPPGTAHLIYEGDEWPGQMLERPGRCEAVLLVSGHCAVIERRDEVDRLLDVTAESRDEFVAAVDSAAGASHGAGRRLSAYSVNPYVIQALGARGYESLAACYYLEATAGEAPADEPWAIANGDRM